MILETVDKICKNQVIDISFVMKVLQTLNLLNGILKPLVSANKTLTEQDYEKVVVFALVWGMGGVYENPDRVLFHEFLSQKGAPLPLKAKDGETVFDYYIYLDDKGTCDWRPIQPDEWKAPERF